MILTIFIPLCNNFQNSINLQDHRYRFGRITTLSLTASIFEICNTTIG